MSKCTLTPARSETCFTVLMAIYIQYNFRDVKTHQNSAGYEFYIASSRHIFTLHYDIVLGLTLF